MTQHGGKSWAPVIVPFVIVIATVLLAFVIGGGVFGLQYPADANGSAIYYFDMDAQSWSQQAGTGVDISSNAGQLFVVASTGGIYVTPVTPSATPTPSPSPTASPTVAPANAIINGDFETGSLDPWYACSFNRTWNYAAPIDPSPAPPSPSPQPVGTVGPLGTPVASVQGGETYGPIPTPTGASTPPAGYQQFVTVTPESGTYMALAGSATDKTGNANGICQDISVPLNAPLLTFYVWEGGTQFGFGTTDDEADLISTPGSGTPTLTDTLFAEINCYDLSVGNASCLAGGTRAKGGAWTPRGPYDLSAYAGQSLTLFVGTWATTHSATSTLFMFVDNVNLAHN